MAYLLVNFKSNIMPLTEWSASYSLSVGLVYDEFSARPVEHLTVSDALLNAVATNLFLRGGVADLSDLSLDTDALR